MTSGLVTIGSGDDRDKAARRMLDGGVRHLVVTGTDEGVISIRDLLAALVRDDVGPLY